MKKLLFGLALAAIAVGGSSFTNVKKQGVAENFMIQPLGGIFIRAVMANGSCLNLHSGLQCKYAITDEGKMNIPPQALYFTEDIQGYLYEGWLEPAQSSNAGLYLIL